MYLCRASVICLNPDSILNPDPGSEAKKIKKVVQLMFIRVKNIKIITECSNMANCYFRIVSQSVI